LDWCGVSVLEQNHGDVLLYPPRSESTCRKFTNEFCFLLYKKSSILWNGSHCRLHDERKVPSCSKDDTPVENDLVACVRNSPNQTPSYSTNCSRHPTSSRPSPGPTPAEASAAYSRPNKTSPQLRQHQQILCRYSRQLTPTQVHKKFRKTTGPSYISLNNMTYSALAATRAPPKGATRRPPSDSSRNTATQAGGRAERTCRPRPYSYTLGDHHH